MKKLYRHHTLILEDSLKTTFEVNSLENILDYENERIYKTFNLKSYYSNISTHFIGDDSTRCGNDWKETYYILVDFEGYKQQCIGICNFEY